MRGRLASRRLLVAAMSVAVLIALPQLPVSGQSATPNWEDTAGGKMSFDVASVKQNNALMGGHSNIPLPGDRFNPTGGLLDIADYPLTAYINFAFKLTGDETAEIRTQLPKWALVNRYDIDARSSSNPTKDQYRLMMQSLLASRFKLAVHFEKRDASVLALKLDKPGKFGPKLRAHPLSVLCPTTVTDAAQQNPIKPDGYPATCGYLSYEPSHAPGEFRTAASGVTMSQIASFFSTSEIFGTYQPVIDKTGLSGTYDFVVEFSSDMPAQDAPYPQDPNGPSFVSALKDQLGLKFDSTTSPVPFVVIDHIEEPSPN
jgi:bla regulator protein BlaR1